MTDFSWDYRVDDDLAELSDGRLANTTESTFVVLRKVEPNRLHRLFSGFVDQVREALLTVMSMTPSELSSWHPSGKYSEDAAGLGGAETCVGFKTDGLKLAWLRQPAIRASMIARGHLSERTPQREKRSNSTRGGGPIAYRLRELPLEEQRAIIRDAFSRADSIDDVFKFSQASVLGLENTQKELAALKTAGDIFDSLIVGLEEFLQQKTAKRHGERSSRGDGRVFAAPWLLMMLAREGVILWPELSEGGEDLVPRLLKPFLWTIFTPAKSWNLSKAMGALESGVVHRLLLLTTNYFIYGDLSIELLVHIKTRWAPKADSRQHHVTQAYRAARDHLRLTDDMVGDQAVYFGGYVRLGGEHASLPFYWVEYPDEARLERYTGITGKKPPPSFPRYMRHWARQLRQVLPMFPVKSYDNQKDAFSYWLIFLSELGDDAPGSWQDIQVRHIASYAQFLRDHAGQRKREHLSILEQGWKLASHALGFHGTIPCPIDAASVLPRDHASEPVRYRTVRQAMYDGLLPLLNQLNRENDFQFARALARFDRKVTDQRTGERVVVFWCQTALKIDPLSASNIDP